MAGANIPNQDVLDGKSIVPILKGAGSIKRDTLFWHYPHYGKDPGSAIRKGDYKLIRFFDEDKGVELYNLKDDISEGSNLAARMPDKVEEMSKLLESWYVEVGAKFPKENPDYDPKRADEKQKSRKPRSPSARKGSPR